MKYLVSKLTYATSRRREGAIKQQKYYCYCWTHGKTGNPEHTSQTCPNKANNHVKTATIADRKGGSARYCQWEIGADLGNCFKCSKYLINNVTCKPSLNSTPSSQQPYLSAADTGASHNYCPSSSIPEGSIEVPHQPMSVTLPNSKVISSEKNNVLPEPKEIPPRARSANVFSQLTEGALTSICQYCD